MDIQLKYTATVTDSGLHLHNRKRFDKEVQTFAGKEVEVIIHRPRSKRSNQQNRYYWAGVVPIVCVGLNDVGYRITEAETHEFLKATLHARGQRKNMNRQRNRRNNHHSGLFLFRQIHLMRKSFLKDSIVNEKTGELLPMTGSTTKLTTVEFMEYIADIQRWAAEFLSIQVPDPNEQVELQLTE